MSLTILVICIGSLWGGMCDSYVMTQYPSYDSCVFESQRVNRQRIDGYAYCIKSKEVEK
jgi:hypothetical protein